ncbi:MAG: ABC transporter permease, partial [Psychrobacter sp.]
MSAPSNNTHSKTKPTGTPASQSFWASFIQTFKDVFSDKGVLLMLIIAPIIYGFFYPWPYSSEVVDHVPVGIIDHDNSNLSRTLVRYTSASPYLDTELFINEQAAKEAIWSDQIAGYMVIPTGLEEQVQSGEQAHVSVLGNGGYFILNKNVQLGFSQAVGTVSAGIKVKKSIAQGAYAPTAAQNTQAVPLRIMPLYNQTEGYGAYVVPAVSVIILQQTLLMATAMLIGTWYEQHRHSTSIRGWL